MHLLKNKTYASKVFFTCDNEARIQRSITRHGYNRSVAITYPSIKSGCLNIPQPVDYAISVLSLSHLLEPAVLQVIQAKKLIVLSLSKLDTEDHFCLIEGQLTLSLTKSSYQRAGLEGNPSKLTLGKWNITLDLTQQETINSKKFQRVKHSFNTVLVESFETVVHLADPSDYSVLSTFISSEKKSMQQKTWTEEHLVPDCLCAAAASLAHDFGPDEECRYEVQEDILTHLALLSLPQTMAPKQDPYISTYDSLPPHSIKAVTNVVLSGFLSSNYIQDLLTSLRGSALPWFAIQIKGFENVTHAWQGAEHAASDAGENCITILARAKSTDDAYQDKDLVMWEILGARNSYG